MEEPGRPTHSTEPIRLQCKGPAPLVENEYPQDLASIVPNTPATGVPKINRDRRHP